MARRAAHRASVTLRGFRLGGKDVMYVFDILCSRTSSDVALLEKFTCLVPVTQYSVRTRWERVRVGTL